MAKDTGDKTPSADEIIEALAIDLGVDGEDAKKKGKRDDTGEAEAAGDTVEEPAKEASKATAPKAKAAKPPKPPLPKRASPTPTKKAAATTTKKKKAASGPKPSIERSDDHHHEHVATQEEVVEVIDQEHGLDALFNISGEGGDPYVEEYYDPDGDDDVRVGSGFASNMMKMGLVLLVTGALVGGTYAAIPDDYRQDIGPLLSCEDVQSQRRIRREIEAAEERRLWLAEQPKYGTLTVLTRPGFSRVIVDSQPTYTEHPSRAATLVETRSGTTFADLDIRNHYVLTVSLPNYEEHRVELYPYDQDASLWQQRTDDGVWFLEMNELLTPALETAEELRLRMTSAEAPDSIGEITVRTNPEGAQVYYNNRLLLDEAGQPLTTPVTFSSYPPPPPEPPVEGQAPPQEPPVEGQEPPPEVPQEPIPVTLRATGVPIRVELEGYLPIITGVYRHMFTCNLNEGVAIEAPFWERCGYTYDTGVLQLMTPEQFAPAEEGSGEGTGESAGGLGTEPS